MNPSRPFGLLDAAPSIHSAHCASWSAGQDSAVASPIDQRVPEEVAAYAMGARRVYSELRRLVGQVAGLLILAQSSNRREALDLPILAAANDLWLSIPEQIERLRTPGRLDGHLYLLKSAHQLVGDCLAALRNIRLDDGGVDLTDALANLATAYAHLQSASEPRFGMTMVDFTSACCNCGQSSANNAISMGG